MKKLSLLTLVVLAFCFQNGSAQNFVGGDIYLNLQTSDDYSSNDFSFSPEYGTFLNDDLAVGGMLDISVGKDKDKVNDTERSSKDFGLGAFARYYLGDGENNIRFYAQGNFMLDFQNDVNQVNTETKSTDLDIYINPKIEMKVSDRLAMDIRFGYAGFFFTFQDAGNIIGFGINFTTFGFGLTYDI